MISTSNLSMQQLNFLSDRVPPMLDKCHTPLPRMRKLLQKYAHANNCPHLLVSFQSFSFTCYCSKPQQKQHNPELGDFFGWNRVGGSYPGSILSELSTSFHKIMLFRFTLLQLTKHARMLHSFRNK